MAKSELEQVLDIVYKAIIRETVSFNYYYRAGNDPSLPDGVRGLLAKLAEEERGHRKILLKEYTAIQKGWSGRGIREEEGGGISYLIPEEPDAVSLATPLSLDVKVVTLPARLVGGDHILTRVVSAPDGRDEGMLILLYDAMGHSIETTRTNSRAASILGEYLDSSVSSDAQREIMSPARLVTHLNAVFSREFQDSGVFITLFAGYLDLQEQRLHYTIAGHEPPMIVRGGGQLESLYNTQLIVGIDDQRKYMEHSVEFGHEDTLCLFSDGILEARDPEENVYGRKRLNRILEELAGMPADAILAGILDDLRAFCSGQPMNDELTLAVVSCCKRSIS